MNRFAIILGIAPCLESALHVFWTSFSGILFDYMAIGVDCSDRVLFDIQHAASYHPEEFNLFHSRRARMKGNLNYKTHSHQNGVDIKTKEKILVDYIWPLIEKSPYSGSSAFLGAQAAVGMGYEKIILCGCPMEGSNLQKPKSNVYNVFQKGWMKYAPKILGDKVKSVSGWTKQFLGEPTQKWLKGE